LTIVAEFLRIIPNPLDDRQKRLDIRQKCLDDRQIFTGQYRQKFIGRSSKIHRTIVKLSLDDRQKFTGRSSKNLLSDRQNIIGRSSKQAVNRQKMLSIVIFHISFLKTVSVNGDRHLETKQHFSSWQK